MGRDDIDVDHLEVTGARPSSNGEVAPLTYDGDVVIIINQAYGPTGESLVGLSDVRFDQHPAITVLVRAGAREERVHLSPIHGDGRKVGFEDLEPGTKTELLCPVSRRPLEKVGPVVEGGTAEYCALYLTPKLERGSMVYISDVWGHHHSRIVHNHELISYWAAAEDGD